MKKRLLCFLIAVLCVLPLTLTACSDEEVTSGSASAVKPLTLTLYGITGETTTAEAILAVQDKINQYTEGNLNTHIVLKLFPEDEYYAMLDVKFAEYEQTKAAAKEATEKEKWANRVFEAMGQSKPSDTKAPATEAPDTEAPESGTVSRYPEAADAQIDIFMVQGAVQLNKYVEQGYVASLNEAIANPYKILKTYISAELFASVTLEGTGKTDGLVDKGKIYGVPNNYVSGEYTYLLINKELADQYHYAPSDVYTPDADDLLAGLGNFLSDAAGHPEYVTLYNEPEIPVDYLTKEPSLVGGLVSADANGFTNLVPGSLLSDPRYTDFLADLADFRKLNYIQTGDAGALPADTKVAAAFLKGNASLPADYEDEYYVVTCSAPLGTASERPGTVFCVSSLTSNVERCMDIITALQTVSSFRNTFQYGVEGLHYTEDEYTGLVTILNHDYSMDPADTGNLFLLKANNEMSAEMLALLENDWALGKQQNRDTVFSPYSYFNFKVITKDNYKTYSDVYAAMYEEALNAAKDAANGKEFDEKKFVFDAEYPYEFTDVILADLAEVSAEYMTKIEAFEEYTDENGVLVTFRDYLAILAAEFEQEEAYLAFCNAENPESPLSQYNAWYTSRVPQA